MHQPAPSKSARDGEGEKTIFYIRIRPKLVLKVSARTVTINIQQKPITNQSPAWDDDVHSDNPLETVTDTETDTDDDGSFLPFHKKKRQARRSQWQKKKKSKTIDTASAFAIPEAQPANRARIPERGLGQKVGFVETTEIYELPEELEYGEEEGPTAMEKMLEMERLKEWVLERSPGGVGEMGWVRRLVELEMAEM
jgi:hypothetical protein